MSSHEPDFPSNCVPLKHWSNQELLEKENTFLQISRQKVKFYDNTLAYDKKILFNVKEKL